jgi:hypothetical protein
MTDPAGVQLLRLWRQAEEAIELPSMKSCIGFTDGLTTPPPGGRRLRAVPGVTRQSRPP